MPDDHAKELVHKEIPPGFEEAYTELVKEIIKEKKESEDYEEGRWPRIDKL